MPAGTTDSGSCSRSPHRFSYSDDSRLLDLGIGVTDLVKRPTRSAAEVTAAEFREGAVRFRNLVDHLRPGVVCYNGKGVYLRAAGLAAAEWGRQPGSLVEGVTDFVVPSPSGLARIAFRVKAAWYCELRATLDQTSPRSDG